MVYHNPVELITLICPRGVPPPQLRVHARSPLLHFNLHKTFPPPSGFRFLVVLSSEFLCCSPPLERIRFSLMKEKKKERIIAASRCYNRFSPTPTQICRCVSSINTGVLLLSSCVPPRCWTLPVAFTCVSMLCHLKTVPLGFARCF